MKSIDTKLKKRLAVAAVHGFACFCIESVDSSWQSRRDCERF